MRIRKFEFVAGFLFNVNSKLVALVAIYNHLVRQ